MTTGQFSPNEWKSLINAPQWIYAGLVSVDRGPASARRSEAKALDEFLSSYRTRSPLVKEIIAGQKDADDEIKGSLEDAERMLGQVDALLDRKAGEDEGNAVRDMLTQAADAIADAAREALIGDRRSSKEEKALVRIEVALKATEADKARRHEVAVAAEAARLARQEREAEARAAAERRREEAERAEAQKKADEAIAKRKAAEAEAKKKMAEAKAKREAEEARMAAEAEAERKAAEEAAALKAAEKAEREAAEAAARKRAAEAKARRRAVEAEAKRKAAEAKARKAAEEAEALKAAEEAEALKAAEEAEALKAAEAAAAAAAAAETTRTYVVKKGDTLSGIAKKMYGNAGRWPDIYKANKDRIEKPSLIRPGWELRIPD